jgi:hypothetical protein
LIGGSEFLSKVPIGISAYKRGEPIDGGLANIVTYFISEVI